MNKKMVLIVLFTAILAGVVTFGWYNTQQVEKEENMHNAESETIPTSQVTEEAKVEGTDLKNADDQASEETVGFEEVSETTPKHTINVLEVITEDPQTDVIIMEGNDGSEAKGTVGVVKSNEKNTNEPDDEVWSNAVPETQKPEREDETPKETMPITDKVETDKFTGFNESITYLEYEAMSGQEQMLFYYSFANADEFNEWYKNAKAEYEAGLDQIYIGSDGSVNMDEIG